MVKIKVLRFGRNGITKSCAEIIMQLREGQRIIFMSAGRKGCYCESYVV